MALDTDQGLKVCRICGGEIRRSFIVQELMLGTRHQFMYSECARCGCLQIDNIPADISSYYPSDYYSYSLSGKGAFKRLRRGLRRRLILTSPTWAKRILGLSSNRDSVFHIYRKLGVQPNSKVLDVGAGAGLHVLELREAGVEGALGLDPFLTDDQYWNGQLLVKKASLEEMSGSYDLITFHHSLEHMPIQVDALVRAKQLLKPSGKILVRIPTVSSEAFAKYQANWFQLDAPRHYYLHSHQSIRYVASEAGLDVSSIWCDSTPMQFILSEQYRRDIPLLDDRSFVKDKNNKMFDKRQLKNFKNQTIALNKSLRGDQICVVMEMQKTL